MDGRSLYLKQSFNLYLNTYDQVYNHCDQEDKLRLRNTAIKNAQRLYCSAPQFSLNKLPKLINAARTRLAVAKEKEDVYKIHRCFLLILEQLVDNQPTGDLDFDLERTRIEKRDTIIDNIRKLRKEIDQLRAAEISLDDDDSCFVRLETLDRQLERQCKALLLLDPVDEKHKIEPPFKLHIKPGGFVSKLSETTHKKIESSIDKLIKTHKKKSGDIVEKPLVYNQLDEILGTAIDENEKLHILDEVYSNILQLHDQTWLGKMWKNHDSLTRDPLLLPKEGTIYNDTTALEQCPPEMNKIFEGNKRKYEQDFQECINSWVSGKRWKHGATNKISHHENGYSAKKTVEQDDVDECEDFDDYYDDEENDAEGEEYDDEDEDYDQNRDDDDDIEIIEILGGQGVAERLTAVRVQEEPKWDDPLVPRVIDLSDEQMDDEKKLLSELDSIESRITTLAQRCNTQTVKDSIDEEDGDEDDDVEIEEVEVVLKEDKVQFVDLADD